MPEPVNKILIEIDLMSMPYICRGRGPEQNFHVTGITCIGVFKPAAGAGPPAPQIGQQPPWRVFPLFQFNKLSGQLF